jgi:hypothetical protein
LRCFRTGGFGVAEAFSPVVVVGAAGLFAAGGAGCAGGLALGWRCS